MDLDPCLSSAGALAHKLEGLNDPEGERIRADLPPVWDTHVHLFAPKLFEAIWTWFETHGWPIRYKLHAEEVIAFLTDRGVERLVGLHYAHKPGIARSMNRFVAELAAQHPAVIPMGTVLPGEPDAELIVREAFAMGLGGLKLHCHVQCFPIDVDAMQPIAAECARAGLPLVVHAGREPKSPAYKCDPHAICHVDRVTSLLRNHPTLKLVIPHLGADETEAYLAALEVHEHLYLDTTMAVAGYFPFDVSMEWLTRRPERILYGTDFPNLPYAWDRELRRLAGALPPDVLEAILGGNARRLFSPESSRPAAP